MSFGTEVLTDSLDLAQRFAARRIFLISDINFILIFAKARE